MDSMVEVSADYRIGKALLIGVMQEQLEEVSSSEVLETFSTGTQDKESEHDQKVKMQIRKVMRIFQDTVKNNPKLIKEKKILEDMLNQDHNKDHYWKLAKCIFDDGIITWEKIFMLFHIAAMATVQLVIAGLRQLVTDILTWTLNFFRSTLVGWIQDQGGWLKACLVPK